MKRILPWVALLAFVAGSLSLELLTGCSSTVRFTQTDGNYKPKPPGKHVPIYKKDIKRPYRVVGVIEAQLGKRARRPELDTLLLKKAYEIGADAVILVEYDVDRHVYVEKHRRVVGHGPWRYHAVTSRPRVAAEKTATGLAVLFE